MKKETIDKIIKETPFVFPAIIILIIRILQLPFQGTRGIKNLWYNLWGDDYNPEEDERIRIMKNKSKPHPLIEKGLMK